MEMRTLVSNPIHTSGMAMVMILLFLGATWTATAHGAMVSSQDMHAQSTQEFNTEEDLKQIQQVLENKVVEQRLEELGYTPEEIEQRLDRLSPEEIQRVAQRAESLQAGAGAGTVLTILAIGILVWLILYLLGYDVGIQRAR